MMINTVLEHVPIKLENFNDEDDDEYSNSNDCSTVWRASSSTSTGAEGEGEAAAATISRTSSTTTTTTTATTGNLDDVIESCGNVFIYSRRKLFLICGFCDCKYANMLQFAKHLNDCHKIFYTNDEEQTRSHQAMANAPATDDSDSDATTTASSSLSSSASTGLIVKGGFQIRFVGEGSIVENDEESLPTPSDVLLRHVPIKVENEQVQEDQKAKLDFEHNIESCGNIFVMNRRKLFLICGFCEGKYANMELFATHLHECHKIFEEDDDGEANGSLDPKSVQVKEEPQEVLVAIKRRPTANETSLPMVAIPTIGNEDIIPSNNAEAPPTATTKRKRNLSKESRSDRASSKESDISDESNFSEEIPAKDEEYFVRGNASTNHSCRKCPKQFKKLSRMLEHVRIHTGEKPHKCLECGKCFRIKLRLTEHQMRHRDVKAFKCELCGLGCATRQDYALHQRHHNGDKRYSCKECGKAFVRSGDLKTHLRIHSDERPFKCEICNNAFRANQNLIMHRRMHDPVKQFKCDYCDKRFRRNIDRKVHHRTHTGEKAYKCEICNRGYSAKVHVRQHIEKRHMNRPQQPPSQSGQDEYDSQSKVKKTSLNYKSFKCTICSKEYSAKYTLLSHMKKFHGNHEAASPTTNKDDTSKSTEVTNLSPLTAANPVSMSTTD